jgi:penicillin-binding protein 1A
MEYEYAGSPVAGGTYPAAIFSDFMSAWVELRAQRGLDPDEEEEGEALPVPDSSYTTPPAEESVPAEPAVPAEEAPEETPEAAPAPETPPETPAPEPAPVDPAPPPTPPPTGGGTDGGVTPEGTG